MKLCELPVSIRALADSPLTRTLTTARDRPPGAAAEVVVDESDAAVHTAASVGSEAVVGLFEDLQTFAKWPSLPAYPACLDHVLLSKLGSS